MYRCISLSVIYILYIYGVYKEMLLYKGWTTRLFGIIKLAKLEIPSHPACCGGALGWYIRERMMLSSSCFRFFFPSCVWFLSRYFFGVTAELAQLFVCWESQCCTSEEVKWGKQIDDHWWTLCFLTHGVTDTIKVRLLVQSYTWYTLSAVDDFEL